MRHRPPKSTATATAMRSAGSAGSRGVQDVIAGDVHAAPGDVAAAPESAALSRGDADPVERTSLGGEKAYHFMT